MRRGTYLQRDPDRQLNKPCLDTERTCSKLPRLGDVFSRTAIGLARSPKAACCAWTASWLRQSLQGRGAAVMQLACAPFSLRPLTRTSSALPRVTPGAASMEAPAVSWPQSQRTDLNHRPGRHPIQRDAAAYRRAPPALRLPVREGTARVSDWTGSRDCATYSPVPLRIAL